ncbi:MAG: S8 family serine peptidase [Silvanigrellales bacterium]|nr:S8 family serine peptidase [Silvanigrellales bacterium]
MRVSTNPGRSVSGLFAATGVASFGLALALLGCTKSGSPQASRDGGGESPSVAAPDASEKGGVVIPSGRLPKIAPGSAQVALPDGNAITLTYVEGVPFMQVHGTIVEGSYQRILAASDAASLSASEKVERVRKELGGIVKGFQDATRILNVRTIPEVGYFSFLMPYNDYESLPTLKNVSRTVLVNPVLSSQGSQHAVKKLSSELNKDLAEAGLSMGDTSSYSGLLRIGVKEFEKLVAKDVAGVKVDGSDVRVGVADTGVTFNHPAFEDASGKNRIEYMKEFTGEGTLYFSQEASLSVRTPTKDELEKDASLKDVLFVTAQYLAPGSAQEATVADAFSEVKDLPLRVSDELRGILLTENNGVRLAILSEKAFGNQAAGEFADINANGDVEDALAVLHVPAADGQQGGRLFVDIGGKGDLRKTKALGDFNATKDVVSVFQEKFGFDLGTRQLVNKKGEAVEVVSAGIVGFDSGNHGSHVSGIIGGRKTLSNDAEGTYARGVAPNARLMVNRVCANNGGCNATEAFIDLALAGAEVINMSLGGLSPFNDGYGVEEEIINRLTLEKNVLFVISAGNSGPGRQTVGSPSVARLSLSVGASASRSLITGQYQWPGSTKPAVATGTNDNDFMLFFSSRGPTAAGGFKPNLSAPGTELSTVQLNTAPGSRSGLDVYWGTSMAAPRAAGAAAILLDAAKKYNAANPSTLLPTDALTLRAVLIESAQAFDMAKLNPKTGASTKGRYTWIDQGQGLINLARAWELLKAQSKVKAPASVLAKNGTRSEAVPLDYEVRVLAKLPNGLDFTGTTPGATATDIDPRAGKLVPTFAKGLWIDPSSKATLHTVQIARRLPAGFLKRDDAGELARQLHTSAETFALETTVYGSGVNWLRAGVLNQLDCKSAPASDTLRIIGEGAVDQFNADGTGTSLGLGASNLYVCTDEAAISALPPGDHGAIIKAFRISGGKREAIPAFEVPVYITKSHKTLAGSERYEISGVARSFDVERNYVVVPEGTSVVNVSLEVPERKADGSGCAGVELMAYEAGNTSRPTEIAPRTKAIASNCAVTGDTGGTRRVAYSRANPRPGVWDLHVFGRYQFDKSPYTLKVDYATVVTTAKKIVGLPAALNGVFNLTVKEATFEAKPDGEKSSFTLSTLTQTTRPSVEQEKTVVVPNRDGKTARTYDASVKTVTINTYGAEGNDIDLVVFECEDEAVTNCSQAASSGTATDVETATFAPKAGKFYRADVFGYDVPKGTTEFTFDEVLALSSIDKGSLTVSQGASENDYAVAHAFDVAASTLLSDERFTSGKYAAGGEIALRTAGGNDLARIPLTISAKDDTSTTGR